jgi:hypothetical protein
MALPPLYKYLDVKGAKLTLGNNTFKHAKPSSFNDTEDVTISSIFPECESAWGPDADRHAKLLIHLAVEGSTLNAY